jgi:transposase
MSACCGVQELPLPATAREQISVGLAIIDAIDVRLGPIDTQLCAFARRQSGCKALQRQYGITP